MIVIRMVRVGRVNSPLYTLVAADERKPRNGAFIEKLGQYTPNGKEELTAIKVERVKHWISKGARLTDTVRTLFRKHNIDTKAA
ncbi:MAG: 30S ribosomal protein S16 [Bacteriovoracaceae bacterium]|nr:30S ribosomal protein S16 [Bacteriovoracaceae bacterium]